MNHFIQVGVRIEMIKTEIKEEMIKIIVDILKIKSKMIVVDIRVIIIEKEIENIMIKLIIKMII